MHIHLAQCNAGSADFEVPVYNMEKQVVRPVSPIGLLPKWRCTNLNQAEVQHMQWLYLRAYMLPDQEKSRIHGRPRAEGFGSSSSEASRDHSV